MATPTETLADGVVETHADRHIVRFERRLAHPIERVWAALTDPAQLLAWLGAAEIELVEGGRFDLRWLNTDERGEPFTMHATITRLQPPHLLETSGDAHGVLRWELQPDGAGTLLRFSSTLAIPEDVLPKLLAGWHYHLDALDTALAGGTTELVQLPNARWYALHDHYARSAQASPAAAAVEALYRQWLAGWNERNGLALAAPFAPDGTLIGFDGTEHTGRDAIAATLDRIFADHPTPRYVGKVRAVRFLTPDTALVQAVAGMIPPGRSALEPQLNAVQTVVAVRREEGWRIAHAQNTPAQYHGRPELVEALTAELRAQRP